MVRKKKIVTGGQPDAFASNKFPAVLLVGEPSPVLERRHQVLHHGKFHVTIAESICHAEIFSESNYFEAAVYDDSIHPLEQNSLAQVMRVRWPWMRIVRLTPGTPHDETPGLFDVTIHSEAELMAALLQVILE